MWPIWQGSAWGGIRRGVNWGCIQLYSLSAQYCAIIMLCNRTGTSYRHRFPPCLTALSAQYAQLPVWQGSAAWGFTVWSELGMYPALQPVCSILCHDYVTELAPQSPPYFTARCSIFVWQGRRLDGILCGSPRRKYPDSSYCRRYDVGWL